MRRHPVSRFPLRVRFVLSRFRMTASSHPFSQCILFEILFFIEQTQPLVTLCFIIIHLIPNINTRRWMSKEVKTAKTNLITKKYRLRLIDSLYGQNRFFWISKINSLYSYELRLCYIYLNSK